MERTHLSTSQLLTILEGATGLSGETHKGGGVISPAWKALVARSLHQVSRRPGVRCRPGQFGG